MDLFIGSGHLFIGSGKNLVIHYVKDSAYQNNPEACSRR